MAKASKSKGSEKLTGIGRQLAFLEFNKTQVTTDETFFVTEKVMESMRDNGYRDIRKALNDLIDNSEQAGAKKIAVLSTSGKDNVKNAKERITNVAVIDDGHGMYPDMLPVAIKWGGTDRYDERDGLGRFGFGLPTASISVTRLYEVYSKVKDGEWYKITVDLNEIAKKAVTNGGKIAYTPSVVKTELPSFVANYIKKIWKKDDLEQGTVVLLKEPDRIRRYSQPAKFQQKMMHNIGLTYRHFMSNITYYVNDTKVQMVDPLFLNPNCVGYDAGNGIQSEGLDEITIKVKNNLVNGNTVEGNIKLRFAFMHPKFQRDNEDQLIKTRHEIMKENNCYFIVCRAGRQIDLVRDTDYQSEKDNITIVNYDANWVVELDFDPVLDEIFGITTNKQQVELDAYLWDVFKEHNIPSIIKGFRKRFKDLITESKIEVETKSDTVKESEQIMASAEKFDQTELPEEKQKAGDAKLRQDAQQVAKQDKTDVEEVVKKLEEKAESKRFKIEYTILPGAPFYDVEIWGQQLKIKLNTAHSFYSNIYDQQDNRGKTAIELLLFVLGRCESEATGDRLLFYGNERFEWSQKLDLRLKMLDQQDPILDKQSFNEEEKIEELAN